MSTYRIASIAVVAFAFAFASQEAEARMFRVDQVPNAENVHGGQGCELCHTSATGNSPRNDFGQQVEDHLESPVTTADVDWQAIYDLDADGDGFTNGEELGDPNGEWSEGDGDPDVEPSDPADPDSVPETGGDTGVGDDAGVGEDAGGNGDGNGGEADAGGDDGSDAGVGEDVGGGMQDEPSGDSSGSGSDSGCSTGGGGRPIGQFLFGLIVVAGIAGLRRR